MVFFFIAYILFACLLRLLSLNLTLCDEIDRLDTKIFEMSLKTEEFEKFLL